MAVDLVEASYGVESDSFGAVLSAFHNSSKIFRQNFMVLTILCAGDSTLKIFEKNIPAVAAAVELVTAG